MKITRLLTRPNFFKLTKFNFSQSEGLNMPVIDIDKFINKSEGWQSECKLMADCLHDTGILVIKDRVRISLTA